MNYREENTFNNKVATESGTSGDVQTIYIVDKPSYNASKERHFETKFPSKFVTLFAILQIVAGSLAIISEVN